MRNFRWAIEKHQACLATDVAGSRHASPIILPGLKDSYGLCQATVPGWGVYMRRKLPG